MSSSLKILFAPMDMYGHYNPSIGFAQMMKQRGHEIFFAVAPTWKGKLAPLGFQEVSFHEERVDKNAKKEEASEYWTNFIVKFQEDMRKDSYGKITPFNSD